MRESACMHMSTRTLSGFHDTNMLLFLAGVTLLDNTRVDMHRISSARPPNGRKFRTSAGCYCIKKSELPPRAYAMHGQTTQLWLWRRSTNSTQLKLYGFLSIQGVVQRTNQVHARPATLSPERESALQRSLQGPAGPWVSDGLERESTLQGSTPSRTGPIRRYQKSMS